MADTALRLLTHAGVAVIRDGIWHSDHALVDAYLNTGIFSWPNRLLINRVTKRTALNILGHRTDIIMPADEPVAKTVAEMTALIPFEKQAGVIQPLQPFRLIADAGGEISYTFYTYAESP